MRKNILAMVLLFCGGLSLSAQSRTGTSVYVLPVTGIGSNVEDNSIFYEQLVSELVNHNFIPAKTQKGADFSFVGTLAPTDGKEFSFRLELLDNKTGKTTVEGELLYETPEDINTQFPVLVSSLLYTIPENTGINDEWRNKWLYVGASFIWSPRIYKGTDSQTNLLSFGGGISAELHVSNFMSMEAGLEFAQDMYKKPNTKDEYTNYNLLEIPLLLKFVFKPGTWFMIEPYAGVQFNIPFDSNTYKPSGISLLGGLQYGVKAGPGAFFVDARFGIDLSDSTIQATSNSKELSFKRTTIHLGVGYKIGGIQRKTK